MSTEEKLDEILNDLCSDSAFDRQYIPDTKAALFAIIAEERIDELKRIPWYSNKRFGIETPKITKRYYQHRLVELKAAVGKDTA